MDNNVQFDFLKSMEIENINKEILALRPSVHANWGKGEMHKRLKHLYKNCCDDPRMQFHQRLPMKVDNLNAFLKKLRCQQNAGEPKDGNFVECLFEMWKLRTRISKARAEAGSIQFGLNFWFCVGKK